MIEQPELTRVVPERLERCWVEDWVDPRTHDPAPYVDDFDLSYWMLQARRRWCDARARWLAGIGVALEDGCEVIPFGRPRFRDAAAFARVVDARFGSSHG